MRWRLRYQLFVPLALLFLGIVGTSVWIASSAVEKSREQLETRLRDVGKTLAESPFPLNQKVLQDLKRLSGADYLLIKKNGERISTLSDSTVTLPAGLPIGNDWSKLPLGPTLQVGTESYFCSGVRLEGRPTLDVLYVFYPESAWRNVLWDAVEPTLILGGLLGLTSLLLMLEVGRRLTKRIQQIERRTRAIADGDFSPMPLPKSDDEIRDLTRSINEMAQRLAELQRITERTERLRLLGQVRGGLAHQLRNGLAGAQLALQVHLQEHPNDNPDEESGLEVALRQLTLLEAHLKRFLDSGKQDDYVAEPCRIDELIHETLTLLKPRCNHAGIRICSRDVDSQLSLMADADQLRQLFLNVIGNAVEAAGADGKVTVRAWKEKHDSLVLVEVLDTGSGPPEEIANRLFEPFVTGKPEGVGLGLAVAKQIAEAHQGAIHCGRCGEQTCFRIELHNAIQPPEQA